jgi:hypothetical protein
VPLGSVAMFDAQNTDTHAPIAPTGRNERVGGLCITGASRGRRLAPFREIRSRRNSHGWASSAEPAKTGVKTPAYRPATEKAPETGLSLLRPLATDSSVLVERGARILEVGTGMAGPAAASCRTVSETTFVGVRRRTSKVAPGRRSRRPGTRRSWSTRPAAAKARRCWPRPPVTAKPCTGPAPDARRSRRRRRPDRSRSTAGPRRPCSRQRASGPAPCS